MEEVNIGETELSHLVCPLCGKNAPLSSFNPEDLELDIAVVSFRGLGRGKGFEVSERYSVLGDDEVTPRVFERVVRLCRLFMSSGVITPNVLSSRLGLTGGSVDVTEIGRLREENKALRRRVDELDKWLREDSLSKENMRDRLRTVTDSLSVARSQVRELEERESTLAEMEESLGDIVEVIEDYTEYEFDPTEDDRVNFISESIHKILEDLEALKAENEE